MKKSLLIAQFIIITLLVSCSQNVKTTAEQPYGEKSGILTFKPINANGVKMTQTVYFDEFGKKEVTETVVEGSQNGMNFKQHTVVIKEGNVFYRYMLSNSFNGEDKAVKEAYKITLPKEMLEQTNIMGYTADMKKKFDYKEEGKETVAGLKGVKYSMSPDTINHTEKIQGVHYKNIPLKLVMGTNELVVEKAQLNVSVPADKFKVPADYKIVDPNAMPQMMPEVDSTKKH